MEEQPKLQRSPSLALQLPRESFKGIMDFPWGMRRGSNPLESEFAAAVAATAFAIHSLEETRRESQRRMAESFKDKRNARTNRSESRRGSFEIADTRSTMRRKSSDNGGREIMVRTSSLLPVERTGEEQRRVLTRSEAWERDELTKIDKKYRKMISKITEWENVKKMKAKLQLDRKKAELERLSTLASLHHQNKREWIESAARGARTQLEEMKRSKETNVQAKAKKVRSTGKIPIKCLCFECYR